MFRSLLALFSHSTSKFPNFSALRIASYARRSLIIQLQRPSTPPHLYPSLIPLSFSLYLLPHHHDVVQPTIRHLNPESTLHIPTQNRRRPPLHTNRRIGKPLRLPKATRRSHRAERERCTRITTEPICRETRRGRKVCTSPSQSHPISACPVSMFRREKNTTNDPSTAPNLLPLILNPH